MATCWIYLHYKLTELDLLLSVSSILSHPLSLISRPAALIYCPRPLCSVMQAVQLESVSPVRVRYLIVVSTLSNKQESILLGMDFPSSDRFVCVTKTLVYCVTGSAYDKISFQLTISSLTLTNNG